MKYFKKLEGAHVYLSPVNVEDAETYVKWLNNPNITQFLDNHQNLITLTSEKDILENETSKEFMLAIVSRDKDQLLGNIGLHHVDYKNGTANLGIFLGEEENLGKGYGSEAINLLLNYCFNDLRLHNIMLTVYDFNERAIKAYTKCGFKEFGRRHDARFYNGTYHDIIYMEIVNERI